MTVIVLLIVGALLVLWLGGGILFGWRPIARFSKMTGQPWTKPGWPHRDD